MVWTPILACSADCFAKRYKSPELLPSREEGAHSDGKVGLIREAKVLMIKAEVRLLDEQ